MKALDPATIIRCAADVLAGAVKPPRLVVLFGSHARGTAHDDSDIDLGFLPGEKMSLAEELALEAELTRTLEHEVDLVPLDTDDTMLKWRAARDGVVVRAVPPMEAARFFARAAVEHDEMAPTLEEAGRRFARRLAIGNR